MLNNKKLLLLACTLFVRLTLFAQATAGNTSTETGFMRSEGKIYVVMIVVIAILLGLILFMLRLDSKLGKLEKRKNL